MQLDIETILRRLMLMGVPLLGQVGCFQGSSSCPSTPPATTERFVEIVNPSITDGDGGVPDAGSSAVGTHISVAAYQLCAETLDCDSLCHEYFDPLGQFIVSCERVATDAFDPGTERLALDAQTYYPCEGRRPEGTGALPAPARACEEVGAFLARAAYLEGVSVPAFLRLERELTAHGAPRPLIRTAARAARDEIRHHRMMTSLARRFGAEPAAIPQEFPSHVRSLEVVAVENATEGCVRESLGAILAREQAARAAVPSVRAALRAIASDEARHANLAFAVDAWTRRKLTPAASKNVARARAAEVGAVAREMSATNVGAPLVHLLGLPARATQHALVTGLARVLARA